MDARLGEHSAVVTSAFFSVGTVGFASASITGVLAN
jgi:hypothetical protein